MANLHVPQPYLQQLYDAIVAYRSSLDDNGEFKSDATIPARTSRSRPTLPITLEHPIRTSRTFYNYLVAKFGAEDLLLDRIWNTVPIELTTVTIRPAPGTDNRSKVTQPKSSQTGRKQKNTHKHAASNSSDSDDDTGSEKEDDDEDEEEKEDEEEEEEEKEEEEEDESESKSEATSESESGSESDSPTPRNSRNHKKTIPPHHPRLGEKRPPQVNGASTKPAKKARTESLRPASKKR